MNSSILNRRLMLGCALMVFALAAGALIAADGRAARSGAENANVESVDMFSAIESGQIAVRLIPKDSTQSRVFIENKTDKPLSVKLPETFGAVPVLAQRGPGGGGGGGSRSSSTGGQSQSMGGGMGGMGGGGGGGMGMFNVPPEKVGQFRVATVCLEHGKGEPNERIPYEIKPLDKVANRPAVVELCRALGTGQVNQRAAQAAAWFLNNDISWQELSAKRYRYANGVLGESYFKPQEIQAGMQLAAMSVKIADEKQRQKEETGSANEPATGHK
jgi:hypothetical protein